MYGVVYTIIDGTNDFEYIGQTTRSVKQRFKEHANAPYRIGKAIRAHGADMFVLAILKVCYSKEEMDFWERHFIKSRNTMTPNGYNLTEGGEGMPGFSPSEETRAQMSASRTGEKNHFFGKHYTNEARTRISMARLGNNNSLGFRHTDESKARMSIAENGIQGLFLKNISQADTIAQIGISKSPEHVAKSAAAQRADSPFKNILNAMTERYLTYKSLAELMGLSRKSISRRMCGKVKFSESDIAKLVEIFGKPAEYLLERSDGLTTTLTNRNKTPYKNLSNAMAEQQISYTALAEILNLSESTVSDKMRGKRDFTAAQVAKLVEIFGKPADYLMKRDE